MLKIKQAINEIAALREEFYKDVKVPGTDKGSIKIEKSDSCCRFLRNRIVCLKMLHRNESCGVTSEKNIKLKMVKQNVMTKFRIRYWQRYGKPSIASILQRKTWYLIS
jgi:succinate dehydrogenase / fumarate reductase flavoprotein subunit